MQPILCRKEINLTSRLKYSSWKLVQGGNSGKPTCLNNYDKLFPILYLADSLYLNWTDARILNNMYTN